jgi:hypothetical protein
MRAIQKAKARGDLKTNRGLSIAAKNAYARGRIVAKSPSAAQRLAISLRQSTANTGGKSKWYTVAGQKVQGTWERDLALRLEEFKIAWEKPTKKKDAWSYVIDGKVKHYTPDFYLPDLRIWVEVKGHWWGNDMRKMVHVGRQYRRRKIILIDKSKFKPLLACNTKEDFLSLLGI